MFQDKKEIKILYLFVIIFFNLTAIGCENKESTNNNIVREVNLTIDEELKILAEEYNQIFFASVFSIHEFRVLIKDKVHFTKKEYDLWTPDKFAKEIYENEKYNILVEISNYINQLELTEKKTILKKIKYWCLGRLQYNVMAGYDLYSIDFFMDALYNYDKTKMLFKDFFNTSTQGPESLSTAQMDIIFFNSLNEVSKWKQEEQISYYSYLLNSFASSEK